jgi:hypothetical protein
MDNPRPHNSTKSIQCVADNKFKRVLHLPCFPDISPSDFFSFRYCEETPAYLRGSVIRRGTRECARDSELYRAGSIGSGHASLDGASTEKDNPRWRVLMTPQLTKYFTIPWLDRIAMSIETFRTTDSSAVDCQLVSAFNFIVERGGVRSATAISIRYRCSFKGRSRISPGVITTLILLAIALDQLGNLRSVKYRPSHGSLEFPHFLSNSFFNCMIFVRFTLCPSSSIIRA